MQKALIYSAMIPLNPKTKKNHQQILFDANKKGGFYKKRGNWFKYVGIPFIGQSAAYKRYEHDCGWFLKRPSSGTIDESVEIKCLFYRKTRIRCDLSNLIAAIDDIMVKYKVIIDDNFSIIKSHDGSRVFIDPDNPRTEIYIYKYVDDADAGRATE